MSDPSPESNMSPSLATCLDPQPVPPSSHPLSPDPDDSSPPTLTTSPHLHHLEFWQSKRRPASIRSVQQDPPSHAKKTHPSTHMRRSTSSQGAGAKLPNDRNLIFDEWITSTAHPQLAAHSLIPNELVDDEKAVQDMLAEAMSEEHFVSVPGKGEAETEVEVEERVLVTERPVTPMSAIDIPAAKKVEVTTRPRSSSSLSLRKWAGIFVGRGDRMARPSAGAQSESPTRPPLTTKRSFSAPDTASSANSEETITRSIKHDRRGDLEQPLTSVNMSPSSSNESIPAINITAPRTPSKPRPDTLHRINSAPTEESPSLDQMRTEAIRTITTLRSPTRLRATTLTTTETRSRSGSDSTLPKTSHGGGGVLSQSSSSTSLTSLGQRSPAPVLELETIVPPGTQPPSVSARWDDHYKPEESGLTDRYGFIVASGHRRESRGGEIVLDLRESLRERTRSDEERWANVATEAEGRIEELRKQGAKETTRVASPFIEGWNTPTIREEATQASVVMTDMNPQSPSPVEARPTSPLANEIFPIEVATTLPSSTDTIVPMRDPTPLTPSLSVSTPPIPTLSNPTDLSTIKLLLSKLNDLHDSLDRANKQRWDKWLSQASPTDSLLTPPPGTKDRKQRFRDFKLLVQGGIPVKYRSKIWAECSGATELSRPGYFEELCSLARDDGKEDDKIAIQQIQMDIHRTMPNNVFFGGNGPGIAKLERVLIAFSRHNPSIGYCQGSTTPPPPPSKHTH